MDCWSQFRPFIHILLPVHWAKNSLNLHILEPTVHIVQAVTVGVDAVVYVWFVGQMQYSIGVQIC